MNFHHLHVVNFDQNFNNNRVADKIRKNQEYYHFRENNEYSKTQENLVLQNKQNKSPQQIISGVEIVYQNKNIDKKYEKDITPNTLPSVRTLSLDDIRKSIKKFDSHKIKQKLKNMRHKHDRLKHIDTAKQRERKKSQDDIKVLYTSQRYAENFRKRPNRKVNFGPSRVDEAKIPSNYLFSTQNVSKIRNSANLLFDQLFKNKKSLLSRKNNRETQSQPHIQRCSYPLVENDIKLDKNSHKRSELVPSSKHYKIDNYTQNDENECPQPQHILVERKKHEIPNILTVPVERVQKISKAMVTEPFIACVKKKHVSKCKAKLDKQCTCRIEKNKQENYVAVQFNKILKTFIKYFLLGVTVIAWSPCIIVAFVCLHLFTPLMPGDVKVNKVDPACSKSEDGFFSRLVECITQVNNKIKCTFEATKNSLNAGEETIESPPQYNSVDTQTRPNKGTDSQPNPKRKYVLYHTRHRGWLIKPLQNITKHNHCKPEVCPNVISNQPRRKTVSFWDTIWYRDDRSHKAKSRNNQIVGPHLKRSYLCSCTYEKPAAPAHVSCHCYPIPKTLKRITRRPFGNQRIIGSSSLSRQRCPRRKYVSCPHRISAVHQQQLSEKVKITSRAPRRKCESIPAKTICKPRQRTRAIKSICTLESKSLKKKKKTFANTGKLSRCIKYHFNCIKCAIQNSDQSWGQGLKRDNLYVSTLAKKPCFWVYKACPKLYPCLVATFRICNNCCVVVLYICSAFVWCPIFLCCYVCYATICDILCCC